MFTFNDVNFSKLVKTTSIERPLLAPQTISSTNIEGRAGSVYHRKMANSFNITVEFMLLANSAYDLMNKIRDIASKIDTSEPKKLIFNDEPDKYIMAIVNETSFDKASKNGECSVTFYCPDPFWYALTDDVVTGISGKKQYTRKGTAESYPIIEIKGNCNGGKIKIETSNQTMYFNGTLNSGETLMIDSELLTAYVIDGNGNKKSAIPNLDKLDFPMCYAGDNMINIVGTNGATVTSYKLKCNSRWK